MAENETQASEIFRNGSIIALLWRLQFYLSMIQGEGATKKLVTAGFCQFVG